MSPTRIDASRNGVLDCIDYAYAQLSALDSSLCWLPGQVQGLSMQLKCHYLISRKIKNPIWQSGVFDTGSDSDSIRFLWGGSPGGGCLCVLSWKRASRMDWSIRSFCRWGNLWNSSISDGATFASIANCVESTYSGNPEIKSCPSEARHTSGGTARRRRHIDGTRPDHL
jgi:hypothetical protein